MEFLSSVLVTVFISLLILKLHGRTRKNLPPGPRPWPLIGNLHQIGPLPHQSLHTLSQTYGKLMHLTFGSTPVVVASSPHMASLFLKTHDRVFASRPCTAAGKYTSYNYQDVIWAPDGDHWNQGRKIYQSEVFSSKRLSSTEYIRVQETHDFVSSLHAMSGSPIVLKEHLLRMILCVASRSVFGRKYFSEFAKSEDDKEVLTIKEFQEMLDEFFILNGALNLGDWMPWLRFLDLQGYVKRMKALSKRFDMFNEHVMEDHRKRMRDEGENFVAKDVVDVLLKLSENPNLEVKLNSDCIKGLIQDLIIGETDTTTTTMEWAMSELIKQPHLMKKATEELESVIGKDRWVQETDFENLPFIDLIIKETLRMHPPVVLLVPHLALEDCKIEGYDIEKGTTVFINVWSIGRDSDLWDDPKSFRPERFLGKDIDVTGQHFELLPFGSGRRMCPGYRHGLKLLRLLLGNMLHGFKCKLPENMSVEDVNMEELHGLSTRRKSQLVVIVEPRLPGHMYT